MKSRKNELKNIKREEAEQRGKEYVAPKKYTGMRERVKHGIITVDTALSVIKKSSEAGVFYSPSIVDWLQRKKKSGFKVKLESHKKKKKGKKKSVSSKKTTKKSS